jgi:hypothetical protein
MTWQFSTAKQPRFNGRENTSSGRPQAPMELTSGSKQVGGILGAGEPGKASGFRPGGHMQTGYNTVGGRSGMQIKIPKTRDQSNVHANAGVDPEDVTQSKRTVEPTKNNA